MIFSILRLKCPACGKGSLKAGLFKTAKSCSVCGDVFEREQGYFAGAIYPMYGLCVFCGGVVALIALFGFGCGIKTTVALAAMAVVVASPYLFWVSRSAFLQAERRFFKRMGA